MSSVELSDADLQSILEFTSTLARKAGELILEGSEAIAASGSVDEKKNSVDLVTEYDVRVEELVKEEIKKIYPGFQLYVYASSTWVPHLTPQQHRGGVLLRWSSSGPD